MAARKVAFFFTGYVHGGGERVTLQVAKHIAAMDGYKVSIVFLYSRDAYTKLPEGFELDFLGSRRMLDGVFSLSRYVHEKEIDVVFTTQEHAHVVSLLAKLLTKRRGIKTILRAGLPLSVLFKNYTTAKNKYFFFAVARLLYRYADSVVAVSKFIANEYVRFGVAKDNVTVISNPLPEQHKTSEVHPWLTEKATPIVVTLARLVPQKNLELLVRAFGEVRKKQSAKLIIFGEGGERSNIEQVVQGVGIADSVSLPGGFVSNVVEQFSKADMFVLSSNYEGFPNVLSEAMEAGLPVIATDCDSGPREIIAPETDMRIRLRDSIEYAECGVLVPVGKVETLAEAISNVLQDTALRATYAEKSKERAKDFSTAKIMSEYEKVLHI